MQLNDYIKQLYGDKESMTLAELTQAAHDRKSNNPDASNRCPKF